MLSFLLLLLLLTIQPTFLTSIPSTVPAFPVAGGIRNASSTCHLDLSSEMFGGVEEACGRGSKLDRGRCCPVLAAWLFAAHARSALRSHPLVAEQPSPMMPETDSKRCADALQTALAARSITLLRPNDTCDTALCFCGIHLHQVSALSCSADFNLSAASGENGELERECRNASHAGCTRCLISLDKLKGGGGSGGERVERMMDKDCRLMGLTWLLGRNKTAYIPTVSAVLRAILYTVNPPSPSYGCSSDQENMPLAVDSIQFRRTAAGAFSSVSRSAPCLIIAYFVLAFVAAVQVAL